MPLKSPATISDVALKAGVSTATVSRLINGTGPISEETDSRVRAAIAELNYTRRRKPKSRRRAGGSARTASSQRPIAFPWLGPFPADQGHAFTDKVIGGLDRTAREEGRPLSLRRVPDLAMADARQAVGEAEGVVIRTSNQREMVEQALDWLGGIPAVRVLGESRSHRMRVDHVVPDNTEVGVLAAEYLRRRGCRRLVFASTSDDWAVMHQRCVAFVRTAHETGSPVSVVVRKDSDAAERLRQELAGMRVDWVLAGDRPRLVRRIASVNKGSFGLFMPRDFELAMVMPQLQLMGVDFNGNAAAIGCDREMRCLSELEPTPATIDLHPEDVGARALRQLLHRIQHPR